jgi:hypothetical protein
MVKQLMIPLARIRNAPGFMQTLKLSYTAPVREGATPEPTIVFGLNDYKISDKVFDSLQTK